jgi:hypothetical protein
MPASVFNIVSGEFALAIVNTGALGYLTTWQAPAGKTVATAVIADYTGASAWKQQVISGRITSRANITSRRTEATFGGPALVTPIAALSSYTLELDVYQDVHLSTGLATFLYTNDAAEAYFLLGLNNGVPPRAIGRLRCTAGSFGGKTDDDLRDTIRLEITRRPSISFGDGTTSVIVGMDAQGAPIYGPQGYREPTKAELKSMLEENRRLLTEQGHLVDATAAG